MLSVHKVYQYARTEGVEGSLLRSMFIIALCMQDQVAEYNLFLEAVTPSCRLSLIFQGVSLTT